MTTRRARATYRHDASSAGLIGGASGGPATGPTPAAVPRHPAYHGSAGATAAARKRVGTLLEELERIDLQLVVVAPPDAMRRAARERARIAAVDAGRAGLLAEAVDAARAISVRAFARGGFTGTWAATEMSQSVMRASDRVAAAAAFEEAAIAEVVSDLVDEHTVEVLRSSAGNLFRLKGLPTPGSLSNLASPRGGVSIEGPLLIALIAAVFVSMMAIFVGLFAVGLVGIAAAAVIASRLARKR